MKSKKFLSLICFILIFTCFAVTAFAANKNAIGFTVESSDSIVSSGQEFSVDFVVTENTGFVWAQASIVYDPAQVTYVDKSADGCVFPISMKNGTLAVNHRASQKDVQVTIGSFSAAMNPSSGEVYTETGKVASITFKAVEGYDGPINLKIVYNQKNVVSSENEKDYVIKAGSLTITSVDAGSHVHTEQTIPGFDATCTKPGLTDGKKCSVCNAVIVEQKEIPLLGHLNDVTVPGYASTCTKKGLTDGKKCSRCNEITVAQKEIALAPHTEVTVPGKAATCTEAGLTDGKKCSVCNKITVEQKKTELAPHTEVTVPGKAATCTATGLTDGKKCSVCGMTTVAQKQIEMVPHTEVTVPGKAATCTATGLTDGKKCSVCGTTTVEQKKIDMIPHTEEIIPAVNATCTSTGLTQGTKCSVCKAIVTAQQKTDMLPHSEVLVPGFAATCTSTGLTDGSKCSVCKAIVTEQKQIPMVPHTEEIIPAVDATCSSTGLTEGKKCSVCDLIIKPQTSTPKTPHITEVIPAVDATCTEKGLTKGEKCANCGIILKPQTSVPAKGHDVSDVYVNTDKNGHWLACKNCDHKESYGKHTLTDGVCSVCGYGCTHSGGSATCSSQAICTICGKAYGKLKDHTPGAAATCTTPQECTVCGKILTVASGHTLEYVDAFEATCGKPGWDAYETCKNCDYTNYKEIPATGHHTSGDWVITKEATVEAAGEKQKTCSGCADVVTEVIPALTPDVTEPSQTEPSTEPTQGTQPQNPGQDEEPKNEFPIWIFIVIAIVAAAGIVFLLIPKKKR